MAYFAAASATKSESCVKTTVRCLRRVVRDHDVDVEGHGAHVRQLARSDGSASPLRRFGVNATKLFFLSINSFRQNKLECFRVRNAMDNGGEYQGRLQGRIHNLQTGTIS